MKVADSILAAAVMLTLASIPGTASAQRVYKCTSSAGVASYQQSPCANESETASVRSYSPVPDAPHFQEQQQAPMQHQVPHRQANSGGGLIGNQASQAPAISLQEKLANIASDRRYRGSPSARRAAMSAAMQEAGLAGVGPYQPPAASPPVHRVVEPTQVRDHSGNTYTQPPGSPFVRDNKTGKQCFTFGDFVKCD